jgi:membrane protein YdbS with pleckstrin-like domain
LILDDLPDVSKKVESVLNGLKSKAYNGRKVLTLTQFAVGAVSFYLFAAVCLFMSQNPQWVTAANILFVSTVFITSITSFVFAKRKFWSNIATDN